MDSDRKEVLYQIFITTAIILASLAVMYFTYHQSRKYYDAKSSNEDMQSMQKRIDLD